MPTILGNLRQFLNDMKRRKTEDYPGQSSEMNAIFRFRYTLFKELLTANSELLSVLSGIDEKLKGVHDEDLAKSFMETRLGNLGSLLIFARQLDMLMITEESVKWAASNFLDGNYQLATQPATEETSDTKKTDTY